MKHPNRNHSRRRQRQEEAVQRQSKRNETSDLQQLKILDSRKVVAFRERARLHARILAEQERNKPYHEQETKQQEISNRQERQAAKKLEKKNRKRKTS